MVMSICWGESVVKLHEPARGPGAESLASMTGTLNHALAAEATATGSIILQASTGAEGGAAIAGTNAAIESPSNNSAGRKVILFPFAGNSRTCMRDESWMTTPGSEWAFGSEQLMLLLR